FSRIRSYPSALEASLHGDNVSIDVYRNLIAAVHDRLPDLHRYMELRRRALGVDQLHMYDLFTPLVEYDTAVPYEQARETIVKALQPLGPTYIEALDKAFDSHWIDVYENKGKSSGAYSWGPYGVHPYVLMNYQDNLNSMFTLAHELGHALHSYFSDQKQTYREAQYPIFLAEVASITNESLMMNYLLENTTDELQIKYLLTSYLNDFRTTVFRQTMFAEFEMKMHDLEAEGKPLTADVLSETYYDLNKLYYGTDMVIDEEIAIEWARIPHFYRSFYVYKYATGFSAATALSHQVLAEGAPAVERYLTFLSSGGSDFPIPILQRAGVDMSAKTAVTSCLEVFSATLDKALKLF
ncbi:MAG: oligopeptidase PepB, partial [Bacilli bacterium]|nr:oligopeptidase PepB [Bacilli bacterium]